MPQLRTIREAAQALSVSADSVRRLIKAGELRAVRISRRVMVPETEIERATVHGVGKYARPGAANA